MARRPKLVPGVQHEDWETLAEVVESLEALGIAADVKAVNETPAEELPQWADTAASGWLLMIEESRFEEGMTQAGKLMGYSPD